MRHALLLVALLASATVSRPVAAAVREASTGRDTKSLSAPNDDVPARLEAAKAQLAAEDFEDASRLFEAAIADPAFAGLPAPARRAAHFRAGHAAAGAGDRSLALVRFRAATQFADAGAEAWGNHVLYAWMTDNPDEGAAALAQLARRFPRSLPDMDASMIAGVVDDATLGSEARLAAVQALADADYVYPNSLDGGFVWLALVEERLHRGDIDGARAAARRIVTPAELVMLRADRRFDPVVDREAPAFDVERAARAYVEDLRARALLEPYVLEKQTAFASALLTIGDAEAVVALAADTEALYAASPAPFVDRDQRVWMQNMAADALRMLGRVDEAAAQFERARRLDESGEPNVSQSLNLGDLYCAMGKPREAREAIADVGFLSDYGQMAKSWVTLCASVLDGDAVGRDTALAWMRTHRAASESLLLRGLLMSEHDDEAAAIVIEQLGDPARRAGALFSLQEFREAAPEAGAARLEQGWLRLAGRDDVRAAAEAVGHLERYDIFSP